MENLIKELYLLKVPFAVVISEEIHGTCFSIVYRRIGIQSRQLSNDERKYFNSIKEHGRKINYGYEGIIYEYFNFKARLDLKVRHQFIEGLNYGRK